MPVSGMFDGTSLYQSARSRSCGDSEPYISNSNQMGRTRALPENNILKSFAADKEKTNSVAKIKVVVCVCSFKASFRLYPFYLIGIP